MKRQRRELIGLAGLTFGVLAAGCEPLPEGALAPEATSPVEATEHALAIQTDNDTGNLTIVSPPEGPPVANRPGAWTDVPGLSTGVYSRSGDTLAITVAAEMYTTSMVWFRVLVDGQATIPSDVVMKMGGENFDGTRSFTFLKENVSGGKHIVQVQWFTNVGQSAQVRDRTLTVNSAAPGWGTGRLVATGAETDWVTKSTASWEDVPGMSKTVVTDGTSGRDLRITFSAQSEAVSGRFFARALIDGQPAEPGDVVFDDPGNGSRGGTRSFTFVKPGVAAGSHTVKIQWLAENGSIRVAERTMAVFSNKPSTTGGGLLVRAHEGPSEGVTSTSWVDLPNSSGSFTTNEPSTNVQIDFAGQAQVTGGGLILRALVDGQPTSLSDVRYTNATSGVRSQSFSFHKKNVLPGTHSVKIQAMVDAGASAWIGDRTLSAVWKRRGGLDFAQPYGYGSPAVVAPRQGKFNALVVCFDPVRPGVPAPTSAQLANRFRGTDGGQSVEGYYKESSGGRFMPNWAGVLGCFQAPAARRGDWYWNNGFALMREDALKAADASVDFHQFDTNKDNHIDASELIVVVVIPQNDVRGFWVPGSTSALLDGSGTRMSFDTIDSYMPANDGWRREIVGLNAHEFAHGALNTLDMYTGPDGNSFAGGYTTRPLTYSLMDDHRSATHLDPFHKLKVGFLTPDVVEINKWTTRTVPIAATATRREATIVYDPAKNDDEYFIVENRWGGPTTARNYDGALPAEGIVVWHVVEKMSLAAQLPPPGTPGFPVGATEWGRLGVRKLATLSASGQSVELRYASGTSSKIRVTAKGAPAEQISTEIAKLP